MEDMDDEFEDETKAAASIIEEKDKVIDQLHKSTTAISQENTGLKSTFKSLEKELRVRRKLEGTVFVLIFVFLIFLETSERMRWR